MQDSELVIRQMRRQELDVLVDWAATEGWNPGLHDADVFWATDPEGFIAADLDGELVGGGSIVSYAGKYGFMGFFIMHPDYRSQGIGNRLWHARLQKLIKRLQVPAVIGMDGVFSMQAYYAKGGFEFVQRDIRFEGRARALPFSDKVTDLRDVPFDLLESYDRKHFPAPRAGFIRRWIVQPGTAAKAFVQSGKLLGYGVIRPCRTGYKIGPLFADTAEIANDLFCALISPLKGETVFLDVPEDNVNSISMIQHYDMKEVFSCAKMYFGKPPLLPQHEIYGVTTFEFG